MRPKHEASRGRLNPFALPLETAGRYRMLLALAFVLAWSLPAEWFQVPGLWLADSEFPSQVRLLLAKASQEGALALSTEDKFSLLRFGLTHPVLVGIVQQYVRVGLSIATVLLVVLAGAAVQRHVEKRRRNLHPRADVAEECLALQEIRGTARELAGITEIHLHQKRGFLDGLAFGSARYKAIALPLQKRGRLRWNGLHRAVFLHELGHWVNGDVLRQERLRGLLAALSGAVIVTCGMVTLGDQSPMEKLSAGLRLVLALAVAWGLWAGWVRARELEADIRVDLWGHGPALGRRLAFREAGGAPGARDPSLLTRVKGWMPWRFHPTHRVRLSALHNPAVHFTVRKELVVLSGFSLALLGSRLGPCLLDGLMIFGPLGGLFIIAPVFLLGLLLLFALGATLFVSGLTYLLTGTLGQQLLRNALAGELSAEKPPVRCRPLAAACLLTASLELGLWVFADQAPPHIQGALFRILWMALTAGSFWLWAHFLTSWGRRFLSHQRAMRPRRLLRFVSISSALCLSLLLWPLLLFRGLLQLHADPALTARVAGVASGNPAQRLESMAQVVGTLWSLGALLALYLGLASWCLGWLASRRALRCPACTSQISDQVSASGACPSCDARWAPWMLHQPAAARTTTEAALSTPAAAPRSSTVLGQNL